MKEGGACTNACICIGTHSQPLLQKRLLDVNETWCGWSTHGPLQVKIGHGGGGGGGSPSLRNFLFRPEGYSNKPNA